MLYISGWVYDVRYISWLLRFRRGKKHQRLDARRTANLPEICPGNLQQLTWWSFLLSHSTPSAPKSSVKFCANASMVKLLLLCFRLDGGGQEGRMALNGAWRLLSWCQSYNHSEMCSVQRWWQYLMCIAKSVVCKFDSLEACCIATLVWMLLCNQLFVCSPYLHQGQWFTSWDRRGKDFRPWNFSLQEAYSLIGSWEILGTPSTTGTFRDFQNTRRASRQSHLLFNHQSCLHIQHDLACMQVELSFTIVYAYELLFRRTADGTLQSLDCRFTPWSTHGDGRVVNSWPARCSGSDLSALPEYSDSQSRGSSVSTSMPAHLIKDMRARPCLFDHRAYMKPDLTESVELEISRVALSLQAEQNAGRSGEYLDILALPRQDRQFWAALGRRRGLLPLSLCPPSPAASKHLHSPLSLAPTASHLQNSVPQPSTNGNRHPVTLTCMQTLQDPYAGRRSSCTRFQRPLSGKCSRRHQVINISPKTETNCKAVAINRTWGLNLQKHLNLNTQRVGENHL